ncbi:MAG: hypothetical protein HRU38_21835 [Saccharospirillaceae bacterium]|nr:hypothetical protein [Pseudomonadales bacterium]NRB81272.1 hypothetical protein [Saccharospirillaceae bacterium]
MYDGIIAKKWKCAEVMLLQASEFLDNPNLYKFESKSLESYQTDLRESDILESMIILELLGIKYASKSGFWRRLKKVATQIDNLEKVNKYEKIFQSALAKKIV